MKCLLLLLLGLCFAQDDGPLVDTNYGTLRGASLVYTDGRFTLHHKSLDVFSLKWNPTKECRTLFDPTMVVAKEEVIFHNTQICCVVVVLCHIHFTRSSSVVWRIQYFNHWRVLCSGLHSINIHESVAHNMTRYKEVSSVGKQEHSIHIVHKLMI